MENKITFLGNEYTHEEALEKMKGHIHWLYWIAGLTAANLLYVYFGQDYFMVAGSGLDTYLASYLAESEESFSSLQQSIAIILVIFFAICGYLGINKNALAVQIATFIYSLDTALFASVYFDIMGLAFHIWALISLIIGIILMEKLNEVEDFKQI